MGTKETLLEYLEADNGNLIGVLDDETAKKVGRRACSDYEIDVTDEAYQRKKALWEEGRDIAKLAQKEKNFPFKNAANVRYPLLTTAAIQFNSRAYPGIVSGNSVVKPKIFGNSNPADPREAQLQRAAQQIQGLPPEQQQQAQMQLSQMAQALEATRNEKVARAENVCEFINWQLFNEIPEWEPDTDRMLLMLPLYGTMFRCTKFSNEKKRIVSSLHTPEEVVVPMDTDHLENASRISKCFTLTPRDFKRGVRTGTYADVDIKFEDEDSERPEEFLEQIRWEDLDGDDFKEPYIVTAHKGSGEVVRISPNYRMEDVYANDNGEVIRIDSVKYYTKYTFWPSIEGEFYDLGFFDLLVPVNKAINTTVNQLLDAGTLQNSGGGFISGDLGLRKKGPINFEIGEYKTVSTSGEDIRRSILPLPFNGPSQTLFQLLGFMVDAGRDIANLKEVLEGNQSRNQPASTTMALIEQGLKVFSAIHKRIHASLCEELQLIRWWNHEIRNPLYSTVIDDRMSQEDFSADELDFIPVSDPSVVTDMQKAGRAQMLMQFWNDPYFDQKKLRAKTGELLNIDGFEDLLGVDPQVQKLQQQLQQLTQVIQEAQERLQDKDLEDKLKVLELRKEVDKAESEAIKNITTAIKNVAEAEAAELGEQLEEYKSFMESLNEERRMGGMARASGNASIQSPVGGEI